MAALITTAALMALTPQQKASLMVVSGLPAPRGVGGVIVRRWDRELARPRGAVVYADQEGGVVKTFPDLPPWSSARGLSGKARAYNAGLETGRALRRAGVHVDLAPVLDLPDGPLGSRQFRKPIDGVAFARGLVAGRAGACVKHFPGLGTLPFSTDERPYVVGRIRDADLSPYRAAVEANVPCVMIGHGVYPKELGPRRATLQPEAYELLRSLGFDGVAITDSLNVVRGRAVEWGLAAARAGADLLLYTSAADARRVIKALVPLARSGELDDQVARVVRFRTSLGID